MSNIQQIYCKVPDKNALELDLIEQGLATEEEEGNVQPTIGVTTWTPRESSSTDAEGNTTYTHADYILALVGWTENSMEAAGLSQEEVDSLLAAGTLSHGTEIGVDVSSLGLHESEPQRTTYGA